MEQIETSETFFTNDPINLTSLPQAEALVFEPLEKKFIRVMYAQCLVAWMSLIGLGWAGFAIADFLGWWIWALALTALFFICMSFNLTVMRRAYRFRGYAMREEDISYRRGIFFTKIHTIPYNRVQQVRIAQDIFDRIAGLYSITVHTAAQTGEGVSIYGLQKETAEQIKAYVLAKIDHP